MAKMKITAEQKADLYSTVVFAKVAADHADMILQGQNVRREAKMYLGDLSKQVHRFISLLRASIATEEGKRAFDAEWKKDYLAWASIFHSLVQMDEGQIQGVERFCLGVLAGEVEVVLTEEEVKDGR